jgi:hypothetical protein
MLGALVGDERIAHPDASEALLQLFLGAAQRPAFLAAAAAAGPARDSLAAALLAAFGTARNWHDAALVLLALLRGSGFGEAGSRPQPPAAGEAVPSGSASAGEEEEDDDADVSLASAVPDIWSAAGDEAPSSGPAGAATTADALRASLARAVAEQLGSPGGAALPRFLDALFGHLNERLAYLTALAAELAADAGGASRLGPHEAQASYSRLTHSFELATELLRLLEFAASCVPGAFLGPGAGVGLNVARLLEVLSFVLSHFTTGASARHLNALLQRRRPEHSAALMAPDAPSRVFAEKVSKAAILAPVVGTLLALASPSATAASPQPLADFVRALARHCDDGLAAALGFLGSLDWSAAFPSAPLSPALCRLARLIDGVAEWRAALRGGGGAAADGDDDDDDDAPEEFLDPITAACMADPVRLPSSGVVVDRSTVARHLVTQATDPFSRQPLAMGDVTPDIALALRIAAWRAGRERGGGRPKVE